MKILLINQCFYPDVVSTAQHLTDLAVELSDRGHEVTVIASSRGYDEPGMRFARREVWNGLTIHRVSGTGLGKRARWRRAIDFASFLVSCALRMLVMRRVELVVVMTSPPMISFLVAVLARVRGWRFAFWVMDLNPDEAIAAGWLREGSASTKALTAMSHYRLRRAEKIIVLDRFVKRRILDKGISEEKLLVIPPWSHEVRYDQHGREKFRAANNLTEKYVVMYSGNHSPCHPLNTLLEAARKLSRDSRVVFCFVGGGSELEKVKAFAAHHNLSNIVTQPYQRMSELAGSLSAADLHVVVMGDPFVGIIHPCKIYNILSIGTPVLYIGPKKSHITDIFSTRDKVQSCCVAQHGGVDTVVRYIADNASGASSESNTRAPDSTAHAYSKHVLMPRMIEALQSMSASPASYDSAVADSEPSSLVHDIRRQT